MARKLRLEFPGAVYHVLNRGNYRRDLFLSAGEAQAFVRTLEEAVERHGWVLHAYVVMRNHYHLAVETPEPNLVAGMHWLQSTFATRFNRLRQERGHLFQGRYQALVVEDAAALGRVVDYIHLNPVRAGIVNIEQLAAFRWCSLGRLIKEIGCKGLTAARWLEQHGLRPGKAGWHAYLGHLAQLAGDAEQQRALGFAEMSKGWAIGTHGWRRALAKEHAAKALSQDLPAAELQALREAKWEELVAAGLQAARQTETDLRTSKNLAPWKVTLAGKLRQDGIPVSWLTQRLSLGNPGSARVYLSRMARMGKN